MGRAPAARHVRPGLTLRRALSRLITTLLTTLGPTLFTFFGPARLRRFAVTLTVTALTCFGLLGTGTAAAATTPARVSRLTATVSSTSVRLSWTNPSGIVGTVVRYQSGLTAPATPGSGHAGGTLRVPEHAVTITRLVPGTAYSFSVFTLNSQRRYSAAAPLTTRTAPAPVTALHASVTDTSATLVWTNPTTRTLAGELVRRSTGSTYPTPTTGTLVGTVARTRRSLRNSGLAPHHSYRYAVFAYDSAHRYSTAAHLFVTTRALPGPVTAAHVASSTATTIALGWTNPVSPDFTTVRICRAVGSVAPSPATCAPVATVAAPGSTVTDRGLSPATTYSYSLWAGDATGHYAAAATVTGTTPADSTPPGPVTGLTATAQGPSSVLLSWTDPSDADFAAVKICRATSPGAPNPGCTAVRALAKPAASFTDTGLSPSTHYYYAAYAADAVPNYSTVALADVSTPAAPDTTPPGPVTGLAVTAPDSSAVHLAWTNPGDADLATIRVCRATGSTAPSSRTCTPIGTVHAPSATYDDTTVLAGTTYSYALFATDTAGNAAAPATATMTVPTASGPTGFRGRVNDAAGTALAGVVVTVTDDLSDVIPPTHTASDGTWTVTGLAGGTAYRICFDGRGLTTGLGRAGYLFQCYNHGVNGNASGPLFVPAGQVRANVDATLLAGATVVGTVRDNAGHPLAHVRVTHALDDRAVTTGADGHYAFPGTTPDTMDYVCTDATGATGGNADAVGYVGVCDVYGVGTILGDAGSTITRDFALVPSGGVHGTVTDTDGRHLGNVSLALYAGSSYLASTTSDADGAYTLAFSSGFAPGVYSVCVHYNADSTGGHPWGETGACRDVSLAAGELKRFDPVLVPRGDIAGTVRDAAGHSLRGVDVSAEYTATDSSGQEYSVVAGSTTAADGTYAIPLDAASLQYPQRYVVCFTTDNATSSAPPPYGFVARTCFQHSAATDTDPNVNVYSGRATTVDQVIAANGRIAGRITDQGTGGGLGGVVLSASAIDVGSGTATSAADGSYAISSLPPGTYRVCVDLSGATGGGSSTGYVLPSSCQDVTVTAGSSTAASRAATSGAAITGTLLGPGGHPLTGLTRGRVAIFTIDPATTDQTVVAKTLVTSTDGTYAIKGLLAGTYYAVFDDGDDSWGPSVDVAQYWKHVGRLGTPTPITVAVGTTTTGISATLDAHTSLSGTLTAGGTPLPGVLLTLRHVEGALFAGQTLSDGNGRYSFDGIEPGSYTLEVDATQAGPYANFSRSVTVPAGSPTVLNLAVAPQAQITGTLKDTTGGAIDSASAELYQGSTLVHSIVNTGSAYTFDHLAAGTWKVCISYATGGARAAYNPQCHSVTLTAGQAATSNFVLVGLGALLGAVHDPSGTGLAGVTVVATPTTTTTRGPVTLTTDGGGNYGIELESATYQVCFYAETETGGAVANGYLDQCYRNVAIGSTPTPVTVPGESSVRADATLAVSPTPVAAFAGTVTDTSGRPLEGTSVTVSGAHIGSMVLATTGVDGTYRVTGLVPDTYTACFSSPIGNQSIPYVDRCYDQTTAGNETPIVVTSGHVVTGVDAALVRKGTISGTVTSAGHPLAGVTVTALDDADGSVGGATTDAAGRYTMLDVPPGTYRVCFYPSRDTTTGGGSDALGYQNRCWGGATEAQATPVVITDGTTLTGVDAVLPAYGGVSGRVTDTQGQPLTGVQVQVQSTDPSQLGNPGYANAGYTDAQGNYSAPGLVPGSYTVCFDGSGQGGVNDALGYPQRSCYGATAANPDGTAVTVTSGTDTAGVNEAVPSMGGISGTVRSVSGVPQQDVEVTVADVTTHETHGPVATAADGTYRIGFLPTGTYTVCFDAVSHDDGTGTARQCWNHITTDGVPTPVSVTAGSMTTGIDATAVGLGAITGVVKDSAGNPLSDVTVSTRQGTASVQTRLDGSFTLDGLTPGAYQVCFTPDLNDWHASRCWNNVAPNGTPTSITVTAGHVTVLGTITLPAQGEITGTVTDSAGAPVVGAGVIVRSPDGTAQLWYTQNDGSYDLHRVSPGPGTTVCFYPAVATSGVGSQGRCYNGVTPGGTPTPVTVPAGGQVVVNQVLPIGGAISGTLRDASGPIDRAQIWAVNTSTHEVFTRDVPELDAGGSWTVAGLTPGTYQVCFYAATWATHRVLDQCWKAVAPGGSPTPVTVTPGHTVTGLDAVLAADPSQPARTASTTSSGVSRHVARPTLAPHRTVPR